MSIPIEEPVVTVTDEYGSKVEKITHPSFGQIGVSRVSSNPGVNLYGSDFQHGRFIELTIKTSEEIRRHSSEHQFSRDHLIKVSMSESQWATLVCSLNMGDGVPCTIGWVDGKYVPQLPPPKSTVDKFSNDVKSTLKRSVDSLKELSNAIEKSGLSGVKKKELMDLVRMATMNISVNVDYVADTFDEHAEKTVERAKQEIHGYMTHAIASAGIQALSNNHVPLALEYKSDAD
jgi:hypothetical protein